MERDTSKSPATPQGDKMQIFANLLYPKFRSNSKSNSFQNLSQQDISSHLTSSETQANPPKSLSRWVFVNGPPRLTSHATAYDEKHQRLYVFGGKRYNLAFEDLSSELYCCDASSIVEGNYDKLLHQMKSKTLWRKLLQNHPEATAEGVFEGMPAKRCSSSILYVPRYNSFFLFGGYGGSGSRYNDLYMFNCETEQWQQIRNMQGEIPREVNSASIVYWEKNDSLLIFGGLSQIEGYKNDLFEFSLKNYTWTKVECTNPPPKRFNHTALLLPQTEKMLIFGGNGRLVMNDMFEYDLNNRSWKQVYYANYNPNDFIIGGVSCTNPTFSIPCERFGHEMILVDQNYIVISGGQNQQKKFLDDIWVFNLRNKKWKKAELKSNESIPGFYDHSWIWDAKRRKILLFGGEYTENYSDELYEVLLPTRWNVYDDLLSQVYEQLYRNQLCYDTTLYLKPSIKQGSSEISNSDHISNCSTSFKVHRCIMKQNPILYGLYDYTTKSIVVADSRITAKSMELILQHLYGGSITNSSYSIVNIPNLVISAKIFELDHLVLEALKLFDELLSHDNVMSVMFLAHELQEPFTLHKCLDYITFHKLSILEKYNDTHLKSLPNELLVNIALLTNRVKHVVDEHSAILNQIIKLQKNLVSKHSQDERLLQHIRNLHFTAKTDETCDVILFPFDDTSVSFPCHKAILAARSQYFKSLLTTGFYESTKEKIVLQFISKEALSVVLEFIYGRKIDAVYSLSALGIQKLLNPFNVAQDDGNSEGDFIRVGDKMLKKVSKEELKKHENKEDFWLNIDNFIVEGKYFRSMYFKDSNNIETTTAAPMIDDFEVDEKQLLQKYNDVELKMKDMAFGYLVDEDLEKESLQKIAEANLLINLICTASMMEMKEFMGDCLHRLEDYICVTNANELLKFCGFLSTELKGSFFERKCLENAKKMGVDKLVSLLYDLYCGVGTGEDENSALLPVANWDELGRRVATPATASTARSTLSIVPNSPFRLKLSSTYFKTPSTPSSRRGSVINLQTLH